MCYKWKHSLGVGGFSHRSTREKYSREAAPVSSRKQSIGRAPVAVQQSSRAPVGGLRV